MLKIIEAQGDNHACGREYGAATRRHIVRRLENFVDDDAFADSTQELRAAHDTCKQFFPQYLRELEGIAEGAGVDFWKLFYFNVPEIADRETGCTSIAGRSNGEVFLLHNEDSVAEERPQDGFLLHFTTPTASFYGFAYAGELPGACYGWNSHGVFFSVNYLYLQDDPDVRGRVSRTFVARHLMEASDIEDAVARLKSGHSASGYHNYVGKGDRLVSVEQFRDDVSVKEVNGIDAHANHYLHAKFAPEAGTDKHSRLRYDRVCKLLREQLDPLQVLADRTNAPYAICTRQDEELHTLSTVRFLPLQHKVEVYEPETLRLQKHFQSLTGGASRTT